MGGHWHLAIPQNGILHTNEHLMLIAGSTVVRIFIFFLQFSILSQLV